MEVALGVVGTLLTGFVAWLGAHSWRRLIDFFQILPTNLELTRESVKRGGMPVVEGGAAQLRLTVIRTRFGKSQTLFNQDIQPGDYHPIKTKPGKFQITVRWVRWDTDPNYYETQSLYLQSGQHEYRVGANNSGPYLRRVRSNAVTLSPAYRRLTGPISDLPD